MIDPNQYAPPNGKVAGKPAGPRASFSRWTWLAFCVAAISNSLSIGATSLSVFTPLNGLLSLDILRVTAPALGFAFGLPCCVFAATKEAGWRRRVAILGVIPCLTPLPLSAFVVWVVVHLE